MRQTVGGDDRFDVAEVSQSAYSARILDLFRVAFGETVTEVEYRWKYEQNPLGPMRVWAAIEKSTGRLAGSYGAYARDFWYRGQLVRAYQRADSMVHPDFQRLGLFQRMLTAMNSSLRDEGVLFQFGYSNDRSAGAIRKRDDSLELYLSRIFYLPLGGKNALQRLGFSSGLSSIANIVIAPAVRGIAKLSLLRKPRGVTYETVSAAHSMQHAFDRVAVWEREIASTLQLMPSRSRDFLSWKIVRAPAYERGKLHWFIVSLDSRPVAHCVAYLEEERNLLKLVDLIWSTDCDRAAKFAVQCLVDLGLTLGADGIATNVTTPPLAAALSSAGFLEGARSRCTYFPLQPTAPRPTGHDDQLFWLQTPIDRDNWIY